MSFSRDVNEMIIKNLYLSKINCDKVFSLYSELKYFYFKT